MSASRLAETLTASSIGAVSSPLLPKLVLEVKALVKEFPGTRALDGVDLDVRRGEIHALLGANGAGKSTLIKAVVGAIAPTAGAIAVDGREVTIVSPQDALSKGIVAVHQHSNLVPQLSVRENLFLGEKPPLRWSGLIDWPALDRRARALLARIGLDLDPRALISALRPDQLALVS